MIRTAALLRSTDPVAGFELPEVDGRAERELAGLLGGAPLAAGRASGAAVRGRRAPTRVRPYAITAVMAVLVAAATAVTLTVARPSTPAGDGIGTAQRVVFDTSATASASDEQNLLEVVTRDTPPDAALTAVQASLARSPQLRVGATYGQYGRQGRFTATGTHRFIRDIAIDRDDSGRLVGGWQTGADTVTIMVMRCPGTGAYSWTVRGRTVTDSAERTIARTEGRCGPGMTAARFVLGGEQLITSIEVTAPSDRTYSLGQFIFTDFASPRLSTPFPTGD